MTNLGERVGQGVTSEVFAYGEGRVLKLGRPGVERWLLEYEARITKSVFESGAPAPQVLDVVEHDGRLGIVYPRYKGETLLGKLARGTLSPAEVGQAMARVHHALHAGAYRADLASFHSFVTFWLGDMERKGAPADVLAITRTLLAALPESGPVCHGDLHADNILVTADGPIILDWVSALSADPMVDLARQHLSLTILPVEDPRPIARKYEAIRPEIHTAFVETYAALSGNSVRALLDSIEPFVPVMAALRLAEPNPTALEQTILTAHIRSNA